MSQSKPHAEHMFSGVSSVLGRRARRKRWERPCWKVEADRDAVAAARITDVVSQQVRLSRAAVRTRLAAPHHGGLQPGDREVHYG